MRQIMCQDRMSVPKPCAHHMVTKCVFSCEAIVRKYTQSERYTIYLPIWIKQFFRQAFPCHLGAIPRARQVALIATLRHLSTCSVIAYTFLKWSNTCATPVLLRFCRLADAISWLHLQVSGLSSVSGWFFPKTSLLLTLFKFRSV